MSPRERAISKPELRVGNQRYALYVHAWSRVVAAEAAGFYLEATTLLESLLSDRMESRASYLAGKNVGFKTLGDLIKTFAKHETNPEFRRVVADVDAWRRERNRVLHELVKFEPGQIASWETKTADLPAVVAEGKRILLSFDELDVMDRRRNGAKPAATEPGAFRIPAERTRDSSSSRVAAKPYSTQPGFVNRNGQTVVRPTTLPGTDHLQKIYVLSCGTCAAEYGANGSDVFQRRCPSCQGGAPGLAY